MPLPARVHEEGPPRIEIAKQKTGMRDTKRGNSNQIASLIPYMNSKPDPTKLLIYVKL